MGINTLSSKRKIVADKKIINIINGIISKRDYLLEYKRPIKEINQYIKGCTLAFGQLRLNYRDNSEMAYISKRILKKIPLLYLTEERF